MEFVNFEEAKKRLGKTDAELEEMRKRGEIRAFRDGPTWKFPKEAIDALAPKAATAEGKESGDTLMSIDADILFAEEEEVPADSAAETWIAADTEGVFPAKESAGAEQAHGVAEAMSAPEAEPAPLALSPETDESSLGAVLSDEELNATDGLAEEPVIAVDEAGLAVVSSGSATAVAPSRTRMVTLVEPPAHHAQFTVMLGIAGLSLAVAAIGLMAAMAPGAKPSFLIALGSANAPLIILAFGVVVVLASALIGYFLDKQRAAREAIGG